MALIGSAGVVAALSPLHLLQGQSCQVGVGGGAVNHPPAKSQRPHRQRQPQAEPEPRASGFRSSAAPPDGAGADLTQLRDLHARQFTDGAVNHPHDGSLAPPLEVQSQTALQEAEALLHQEAGAEDEEEAAASLHRLQDGVRRI